MTILGDPIPCSGRPDWLRDDDVCAVQCHKSGNWCGLSGIITARDLQWPIRVTALRLASNHPVYAIIKAGLPLYTREAGGWRPWFGESAYGPGDYGGLIFTRGGGECAYPDADVWYWPHSDGNADIIAYLAKPAEEISPNASIPAPDSPETQPEEIVWHTPDEHPPEYEMVIAEYHEWNDANQPLKEQCVCVMQGEWRIFANNDSVAYVKRWRYPHAKTPDLATAISVIESHGYAAVQRRTLEDWEEWAEILKANGIPPGETKLRVVFDALGLIRPDLTPTERAARAIADGTATDEQRAFYEVGRAGR